MGFTKSFDGGRLAPSRFTANRGTCWVYEEDQAGNMVAAIREMPSRRGRGVFVWTKKSFGENVLKAWKLEERG